MEKVWILTKIVGSEKVWKSLKTGFSKHSEILEIVLFRTFPKLRKNDVKLGLRKSRKTRSDLKTDSKVRFKVWRERVVECHHTQTVVGYLSVALPKAQATQKETQATEVI